MLPLVAPPHLCVELVIIGIIVSRKECIFAKTQRKNNVVKSCVLRNILSLRLVDRLVVIDFIFHRIFLAVIGNKLIHKSQIKMMAMMKIMKIMKMTEII